MTEQLHILCCDVPSCFIISTDQITSVLRSGKVLNPMPYFSPRSGVVQELSVRAGDYVSEGTAVVQLADLTSVWVEAQLYATDQPLRSGQPVRVSFPAFPGQMVTGRVSFISPELAAGSKVTLALFTVSATVLVEPLAGPLSTAAVAL